MLSTLGKQKPISLEISVTYIPDNLAFTLSNYLVILLLFVYGFLNIRSLNIWKNMDIF